MPRAEAGADFGDLGGFADVFNDLFGDIFGGGGRGGRRAGRGQRGADLRYNLEIDLNKVLSGYEATLEIPKMRSCEECSGSGARAGTSSKQCEGLRRCRAGNVPAGVLPSEPPLATNAAEWGRRFPTRARIAGDEGV